MVLVSRGTGRSAGQPLYDRLWGSGMLPTRYQGVKLRSGKEPVLYLGNPAGCPPETRREMLNQLRALNQEKYDATRDPEILTRIEQYELAFRMQSSASEAFDISQESASTLEAYGAEPGGESFANNCLLARRLAERGVRFIQLFHWGWDSHGASASEALNMGFKDRCMEVDRPITALLSDLEQRGLLQDTLVVWGGEFGRTPFREGRTSRSQVLGRDHYPDCFTMWMAGAGVKAGTNHGLTDELGFSVVDGAVHVHDLQATILHLLGFDHERLVYRFQGRNYRLTDVHGHVVRDLLA